MGYKQRCLADLRAKRVRLITNRKTRERGKGKHVSDSILFWQGEEPVFIKGNWAGQIVRGVGLKRVQKHKGANEDFFIGKRADF